MSQRPIITTAPPGFRLRWFADDDLPFLAALYASTRAEELEAVPWSDEQKAAFLQWQFESQHTYYQEYYPTCEFLVIERPGDNGPEPIGRLYVDRWPEEIRLVDIALVPDLRGHGAGEAILRELLAEGERSGLPVSIHVEHNNPAMRLYQRLGFVHIDTNGIYHLMRREPGPLPPSSPE